MWHDCNFIVSLRHTIQLIKFKSRTSRSYQLENSHFLGRVVDSRICQVRALCGGNLLLRNLLFYFHICIYIFFLLCVLSDLYKLTFQNLVCLCTYMYVSQKHYVFHRLHIVDLDVDYYELREGKYVKGRLCDVKVFSENESDKSNQEVRKFLYRHELFYVFICWCPYSYN
jgi:hypothetical protein